MIPGHQSLATSHFIILLFDLVITFHPAASQSCRIYYKYGEATLSCAKENMNRVPHFNHNIPPVNVIDLSENSITAITNNPFKGVKTKGLRLGFNNIEYLERNAFKAIRRDLRLLDLRYNKLTSLPIDAIMKLKHLRKLDLSHNAITYRHEDDMNFVFHASEMQVRLESIDLSYNPLRGFYQYLKLGSGIKEFRVSNAELSEMPPVLVELHDAVVLDLSGNRIRDISDEILKGFKHLEVLHLDRNAFKIVPSGMKHLKNLKLLTMSGNQIQYIHKDTFFQLVNLKIVSLSNNKLTGVSAKVFESAHARMTVDLSSNKIRKIDQCFLASSVRRLYLERNKIECDCPLFWLIELGKVDTSIMENSDICGGEKIHSLNYGLKIPMWMRETRKYGRCPEKDLENFDLQICE
ncbi:insulin-like growth factor-binding protein complex acid labile subunit isoform X2 [Lineus longissimus]